VVCCSSIHVWEDVHPKSREFIKCYLVEVGIFHCLTLNTVRYVMGSFADAAFSETRKGSRFLPKRVLRSLDSLLSFLYRGLGIGKLYCTVVFYPKKFLFYFWSLKPSSDPDEMRADPQLCFQLCKNRLFQFPWRLMVKMEAGQVVEVELDGKWWITKVQEVSMLIILMKTDITPPPPPHNCRG
jgi:hypothetical protein